MNLRQHLIKLIETYATAKGISPSRVGQLLFSSGAKYQQLVDGADITVGRYEAAVKWLSGEWPTGVDWPTDVPRPQSSSETSPASSLEEVVA